MLIEETMEFGKPNISEDLATSLVKTLYGLDVLTMKKMESYADQNFHIMVSPIHQNPYLDNVLETGYTLKITNTLKSAIPGYFDSMHDLMSHQNQKGLRTPLPLLNVKGGTWSLERVPLLNKDSNQTGPKYCGFRILSYISGSPVEDILSTSNFEKDIYFQWGSLLGKFHNAAQDFQNSFLKEKQLFWSLENIPKIKDYIHNLPEGKKELVNGVLNKYTIELEPNYHLLPKGVIHGDFNQNNVLVRKLLSESGEKMSLVDGILDFEDMHIGTYVWDVGVMLAYSIIVCNEENVIEAPGYTLAGYLSVRPLNSLEKSLVKMCAESRLCQSMVLCAHCYQQDSKNTYLLNSAKTGWTKLKIIFDMTKEDLHQAWKNIELVHCDK